MGASILAGAQADAARPTLTRRSFLAGAAALGALLAAGARGSLLAPAVARADDASASQASDAPEADSDTSGAKTGGTFVWAALDPTGIEPFFAEETQGMEIISNLYDTLTRYDWTNGVIKPLACESYEANDDATQFTFHLRQGATFHNGAPVTSRDFKYSWERLCKHDLKPSPSTMGYVLSPVKGADEMMAGTGDELDVECPDDYTFVVNLKDSFADFAFVTTNLATAPVPAGCTDTEEDFQTFSRAPIGNGPFQMDGSWEEGQYVNLKRYDGYWGDKAFLDGVNFQLYKDNQTSWTEFQAGNLDMASMPTGTFQSSIAQFGSAGADGNLANPGQQVLTGAETTVYYLPCNLSDEVMGNKDLRIGISYALDRKAICDTVLEGSRTPASDMFMPNVPGYQENAWPHCPETKDMDKAAEYLDKAGYPADASGSRGLTLTLKTNTSASNSEIFQMIQADLAAVGITANIETQEWAAYLGALQDHDFQMGRMGGTMASPTPYYVLHDYFYTGVSNNYGLYSNPDFDAAVDNATKIVDDDERIAAYQAANAIVAQDFPCIPMFYYTHGFVTGSRVHNLFFDGGGMSRLNRCWVE